MSDEGKDQILVAVAICAIGAIGGAIELMYRWIDRAIAEKQEDKTRRRREAERDPERR